MLIITLTAAALLSAATSVVNTDSGRDRVLIEPRPWPSNRVDSPDRAENGRLWHSRFPVGTRTPLAEQPYARRNAARYGAPAELNDDVIYARVRHLTIAVNPWDPFTQTGFDDLRTAQNIWLREQGWVLKVRTHVNPLYQADRARASVASDITPRATIRLHPDPATTSFPSRLRVDASDIRIHKPMIAGSSGPFRVIEAAEATIAETISPGDSSD